MDCCQCLAIESHFDRQRVAKKLDRYRQRGSVPVTRMLAGALVAENVQGMTLLDIGGGFGAIEHELLDAGVTRATNIEASSAYLEAAREEAARRGYSDRITFMPGNFVDLAPEIPQADIVTLDRVICCYDDYRTLVSLSCEKAKSLYGVVYPRDNVLVKALYEYEHIKERLKRSNWRVYVHPTAEVERIINQNGFSRCYYATTLTWQVTVFSR